MFKRWTEFHEMNPSVYSELVTLANKVKKIKEAYSIYALFHVIRFNKDIKTVSEDFKLSNDYIPFYARFLICEYPEFDGFFKIKGGKHVDRIPTMDFVYYSRGKDLSDIKMRGAIK